MQFLVSFVHGVSWEQAGNQFWKSVQTPGKPSVAFGNIWNLEGRNIRNSTFALKISWPQRSAITALTIFDSASMHQMSSDVRCSTPMVAEVF